MSPTLPAIQRVEAQAEVTSKKNPFNLIKFKNLLALMPTTIRLI